MRKITSIMYSEKIQEFIFIGLIATVFTFGFMYRIIDPRLIFWFSVVFCLYELKMKRVNPFNISFLLLFETYLLTGIMDYSKEPWLNLYWSNLKFVWIFPTVYTLGMVASSGSDRATSKKRAKYALLALAFGMFGQVYFVDFLDKNVANRVGKKWPLRWAGPDFCCKWVGVGT